MVTEVLSEACVSVNTCGVCKACGVVMDVCALVSTMSGNGGDPCLQVVCNDHPVVLSDVLRGT